MYYKSSAQNYSRVLCHQYVIQICHVNKITLENKYLYWRNFLRKSLKIGLYRFLLNIYFSSSFWLTRPWFLGGKYAQLKVLISGLPWWRSGWESACQCRGHGFEPWSGRIPHAAERLGPWATITEPARLEPVLRNQRGRNNERPTHHDEEWPPLAATRESPRTETKTQHSHE